jgi:DNA replication protein DnaC
MRTTNSLNSVKSMLKSINLSYTVDNLEEVIKQSEAGDLSYEKFLELLLAGEIRNREQRRIEKWKRQAMFPIYSTLDEFDISQQQSLSKKQFNQLKELTWIEQGYNIIFLGPPGVGKTHIAVGLGIQAVNSGYKVQFMQMNDLVHTLKTQEVTKGSQTKIKRIIDSDGCDRIFRVEINHRLCSTCIAP